MSTRSDSKKALMAYEKTVSIQPNFASGQRAFGIFEVQRKHYPQALSHLLEAQKFGINDAHLFNFMGICYSQMNQLQKAIDSFHKAIGLDANLAEAHLNLAFAYQRREQQGAAASEYAAACRLESRFCGVRAQTAQ